MTTVYNINNDGIISEVATYSQDPFNALKCAYLQFIKKNFNTWNYAKVDVPIKETRNGYCIFYDDNSSLYVRNK